MKPSRRVVLLIAAMVLLLSALAPIASAGVAPASTAGATCPPIYHRVVRGEILSQITARYGVSIWQLQQWNNIANIDRIYAGQTLVIHRSVCPQPPKPRPTPKPPLLPGPCQGSICPPPTVAPPVVDPPVIMPPIGQVCPDGRVQISAPTQGSSISGIYTVTGSAIHENFKFYKLEYGAGINPTTWNWFFGSEWPVWQGTLGALNTTILPAGLYTIKLTVVDRTSNYPTPCQVLVRVP